MPQKGIQGEQIEESTLDLTNTDGSTIADVDAVSLSGQVIGTGANNLVQLDATARLPAVDGSLLTNLPPSGITDIVTDTTPQLGGNLDLNGNELFSVAATTATDPSLIFRGGANSYVGGGSYGGGFYVYGGAASNGNWGGGTTIYGGNGLDATSTGGWFWVSAGYSAYRGGSIDLWAGNCSGNFGGAANVQGGSSYATGGGGGSFGGSANVTGGDAVDDLTNGRGGQASLRGGSGSKFGGNIIINSGSQAGTTPADPTGSSGTVQIRSGTGTNKTGSVTIASGQAAEESGGLWISTGQVTGDGDSGNVDIGVGSTNGAGQSGFARMIGGHAVAAGGIPGYVSIIAGGASVGSTADGAEASLVGGQSATANGGNVNIVGGTSSAVGQGGSIKLMTGFGTAGGVPSVEVHGPSNTANVAGSLKFFYHTNAAHSTGSSVELKASTSLVSDLSLTLPIADGTNGQVLQTNGAGVLSFVDQTAVVPSASETVEGIVELATQAEVDAGTDPSRVVTAATLTNFSGLGGGGGTTYNWLIANNGVDFAVAPSAPQAGEADIAMGDSAVANGSTLGGAIALGSRAIGFTNGAQATAGFATAVGTHSQATGQSSVALGSSAVASSNGTISVKGTASAAYAIAVGRAAQARGADDIVMGQYANTGATGSSRNVLLGRSSSMGTSVSNSVAIGQTSSIGNSGSNSVVIGSAATTPSDSCVVVGHNSAASTFNQTIIGPAITSTDVAADVAYSLKAGCGTAGQINLIHLHTKGHLQLVGDEAQIEVPTYATASEPANPVEGSLIYDSTTNALKTYDGAAWNAVGGGGGEANTNWIYANGGNDFAIAPTAPTGAGINQFAIGNNASASSAAGGAMAIGTSASVTAVNSIAVGHTASGTANGATALGERATCSGVDSLAIGTDSDATANTSISVGNNSDALATNAIAIGNTASVGLTFTGGTAIGKSAVAGASYGQAFGEQATANGLNSIALGRQTVSTLESQVVIGTGFASNELVADAAHSVKIGSGNATNSQAMFLSDRGHLALYGPKAQFIIPNYATAAEPANPVSGSLIYDSTLDVLKTYDGAAWNAVGGGGGGLANPLTADLDTGGYSIITTDTVGSTPNAINIKPGTVNDAATTTGAAITITGGDSTSGTPGKVSILGGDGNHKVGQAGDIDIIGGNNNYQIAVGTYTNRGGNILIQGGFPNKTISTTYGGNVKLVPGEGGSAATHGAIQIGSADGAGQGSINILDDGGSFKTTIKIPVLTGDTNFQLPADNGTVDYVLRTDGSGNTSWIAAPGGGNNWLIANNGSDFTTAPTAAQGNSISIGDSADNAGAGSDAITIGTSAYTYRGGTIAIGRNTKANRDSAIAIGDGATTGGTSNNTAANIAIGNLAQATDSGHNIAIGKSAYAASSSSISIGLSATSNLFGSSITIGTSASSGNTGQLTLGHFLESTDTTTNVPYSVKIGYGLTGVNKQLIHLFDAGKLELYGDKAQFIIPGYATASEPASPVEGSLIYDTTLNVLKAHDGAAWKNVANEELVEFSETANAIATTGAVTLDLTTGTYFYNAATTGVITFTFSNPAASGRVSSFTLELFGGATNAPVWPASVKWPGGVEPTWSAGVDVVSFSTRDNGTTWLGMLGGTAFA